MVAIPTLFVYVHLLRSRSILLGCIQMHVGEIIFGDMIVHAFVMLLIFHKLLSKFPRSILTSTLC